VPLVGVLYDLSDRELCEEIRMHADMRWLCRLNFHEVKFWAPTPRGFGIMRVSQAGSLTGLEDLDRGRDLRIKPYAISWRTVSCWKKFRCRRSFSAVLHAE